MFYANIAYPRNFINLTKNVRAVKLLVLGYMMNTFVFIRISNSSGQAQEICDGNFQQYEDRY